MRQWFCKIIVHTKFPISAANFTRKKNYFLYQSIITNFDYVLKTLNSFFPSNGLYAAISVRIRGTIQMKIHSLTLKIFIEFHMLPPDKKIFACHGKIGHFFQLYYSRDSLNFLGQNRRST